MNVVFLQKLMYPTLSGLWAVIRMIWQNRSQKAKELPPVVHLCIRDDPTTAPPCMVALMEKQYGSRQVGTMDKVNTALDGEELFGGAYT